jgi:hypothetical protein
MRSSGRWWLKSKRLQHVDEMIETSRILKARIACTGFAIPHLYVTHVIKKKKPFRCAFLAEISVDSFSDICQPCVSHS